MTASLEETRHQASGSSSTTTTTKDELALLNSSITTASTTCSSSSSSSFSSSSDDFWNLDLSDLLLEDNNNTKNANTDSKPAREAEQKGPSHHISRVQDSLFQQYLSSSSSSSSSSAAAAPSSSSSSSKDGKPSTPPITTTKRDHRSRNRSPLRLLSLPNKQSGGGRSRTLSPLPRLNRNRRQRRCLSLNNSSKPVQQVDLEPTNSNMKRSVSFDKVQIREFNQVLGDNPCKDNNGPSLALGWRYHEKKTKDIDKYESSKNTKNFSSYKSFLLVGSGNRGRETPGIPHLSAEKRRERALKLGYTLHEIHQNQQQNFEIQQQRQQTLREEKEKQKALNSFTATTLEEALVLLERGQLEGIY